MDKIRKNLDDAWEYRFFQKLEEASFCLHQILYQLDVDVAQNIYDVTALSHQEELIESLCLKASIARLEVSPLEALDQFCKISILAKKKSIRLPFRYYFELGMTYYLNQDYSKAIEIINRAHQLATSNWESALTLINLYYCFDHLNLNRKVTLERLYSCIDRLSLEKKSYLIKLLSFVSARENFRRGFSIQALDFENPQAVYFKDWVNSLPYWGEKVGSTKEMDIPRYGLFDSYRFRTVSGVYNPIEDECQNKLTEKVDRLYLWTWKWLMDPVAFSFKKTESLLNLKTSDIWRLTIEDRWMLQNSISWIVLFNPMEEKKFSDLIQILPKEDPVQYGLFHFESLVVGYFKLLRDGKFNDASHLKEILMKHELMKSKNIYLFELLEEKSFHLKILKESLDRIVKVKKKKNRLSLDPKYHTLRVEDEVIVSNDLSAAILILSHSKTVTLKEFVDFVFGFKKFDSLIHLQRVQTLLNRLRKILGDQIKICIKEGVIYSEGDWSIIEIEASSVHSVELGDLGIKQKSPTVSEKSTNRLSWLGWRTRLEIENEIKRPRSTTNRILKNWVNAGLVEKKGSRKLAVYQVLGHNNLNLGDRSI